MERVRNGYGTDTERERERVWNGYRTRSVKRSLLGFFWSVLYKCYSCLEFWNSFWLEIRLFTTQTFFSCTDSEANFTWVRAKFTCPDQSDLGLPTRTADYNSRLFFGKTFNRLSYLPYEITSSSLSHSASLTGTYCTVDRQVYLPLCIAIHQWLFVV